MRSWWHPALPSGTSFSGTAILARSLCWSRTASGWRNHTLFHAGPAFSGLRSVASFLGWEGEGWSPSTRVLVRSHWPLPVNVLGFRFYPSPVGLGTQSVIEFWLLLTHLCVESTLRLADYEAQPQHVMWAYGCAGAILMWFLLLILGYKTLFSCLYLVIGGDCSLI